MSATAERIRFLDGAAPALAAGEYEIAVEQRVRLPAPHASPSPYRVTQRLRVSGPRFGLAPGDVSAAFPAAGAEGTYDDVLPHVVLARGTLPWEVSMPGAPAGTPWLALLLLAPDEIVATPGMGPTGARPVDVVEEYLALDGSGVAGPVPDGDRAGDVPAPDPESGAPARAAAVDIRADAFSAVAPRLEDLRWLAHVRRVDAGPPSPESFSVVAANRMPDSGHSSTWLVHLVSLDGFARRLPGGDAPPRPGGAVRLLSLASWAFRSDASRADFAALMRRATAGAGPLRLSPPEVREPADPGARLASDVLGGGWAPLAYQTRVGTPAAAWYRGPLAPGPVPAVPRQRRSSSDAALSVDPGTAMFDVSRAAAWQLGRLLTLANRPAAAALAGWVDRACGAAQALAEAHGQAADRAAANASEPDADAPALDPAGLAGQEHRLPGVLDPVARAAAAATSVDPALGVARAVLGASR